MPLGHIHTYHYIKTISDNHLASKVALGLNNQLNKVEAGAKNTACIFAAMYNKHKQCIINTTLLKQKPSLYLQSHKMKYKYFCH